jgi:hypothetical protein
MNLFSFVFLFCTVLLRHLASFPSGGGKICDHQARNAQKKSCQNYREFRTSEVSL